MKRTAFMAASALAALIIATAAGALFLLPYISEVHEIQSGNPWLRKAMVAAREPGPGAGADVLAIEPGTTDIDVAIPALDDTGVSSSGNTAVGSTDVVFAADTKPAPGAVKDARLQSQVSELSQINSGEGLGAALDFANGHGMMLEGDSVVVVLESAGDSRAAAGAVTDAGGKVESISGKLVQAAVPIGAVPALSASPTVAFIREPLRPELFTTSEGVADIGADIWQSSGETGSGVKLAILDLGFQGYGQRQAEGELPAGLVTMSFRADGDITGGGEPHGTACAEIAYDVAPGAQFYLVNFSTDVELANAVDYLKAQGVDVISASWGFFGMFRGDGQGPVDDIVQDAHSAGITWVNAAGNSARSHWNGAFSDSDTDSWTEFATGDEGNDLYLPAGAQANIYLNWNGWPYTDQDYDLYLFWSGQPNTPVAKSDNWQSGSQPPDEQIHYVVPQGKGGIYWVAINSYSSTGDGDFQLYTTPRELQYYMPAGSLGGQPADSPDAITVGAVPVGDTVLEYFSSQGPTLDGRKKPDIVAPDRVSTVSYGSGGGFWGTSASTPHAAAAAALVLGAYPDYTTIQVQAWLEGRAADLGLPGKDDMYGSGKLNLGPVPDTEPPVVSAVQPSGVIYSTSAAVSVYYSDAGSGIDPASAAVLLDGNPPGGCTVTTGSASCSVYGLSEGSHVITGSVADNAGNVTPFNGSFDVVCSQPALNVGSPNPFWASYDDYIARMLSVTFRFCNSGPDNAYGAQLLGSVNTSGVQLETPAPADIGDLAAGGCNNATFKFLVPPGVTTYKSTLYITATSACGIGYSYPGPYVAP